MKQAIEDTFWNGIEPEWNSLVDLEFWFNMDMDFFKEVETVGTYGRVDKDYRWNPDCLFERSNFKI